jgi:hypothetical protein
MLPDWEDGAMHLDRSRRKSTPFPDEVIVRAHDSPVPACILKLP